MAIRFSFDSFAINVIYLTVLICGMAIVTNPARKKSVGNDKLLVECDINQRFRRVKVLRD